MVQRRLYTFRIDPDLDAGFKLVKDKDGIAESEQIRRAVREWLERRGVITKTERRRVVTRKRS